MSSSGSPSSARVPMQYRALGASGLRVSALSLGGWLTFGGSIEQERTEAILKSALAAGINFIDLADVYARGAAELAVGRALRGLPRAQLVISSKVYWPMSEGCNDRGLSRKHVFESVHASLERLGTSYLDIYFCHREDPEVPLEETVEAMSDLVRSGKVHYWGTSVWRASTLARAHALARDRHWVAPVVEQPRYNLLDRSIEAQVQPQAQRLGMGLVVWSPLAGGVLSGKYNDGIPAGSRGAGTKWLERELQPESLQRVRSFCALAAQRGCTPATLALAWVLQQPGISSAILGATHESQLEENLAALSVPFDAELARALDRLFPPRRPSLARRALQQWLRAD
jgi:voltage-dependent potassium channel beta subunit